ncbi:MAG: RNA 2',3'-cyclic phosphodiesterase [Candidatus Thermoplasmatota archaeon]
MAFRAFVGVPVGPSPALASLLDGLAASGADLKVVEPTHLHVTFCFLGDVPDDAVPRIAAALDDATRGQTAFLFQLQGVGAFPNVRHPRVVWAGSKGPEQIVALALRTRERLGAAGFPGDAKDFRAHVTLARVRSERGLDKVVRFLREHGRDELPEERVREVVLFKSTLGPHGPSYERLHSAALEGA